MKFQRFVTGRGNRGYGFRAVTEKYPSCAYLKVRESDTGEKGSPVLELMTTAYGQIGAIASYHIGGAHAYGYTDVLFPKVEKTAEGEILFDNPGRLLYLEHMSLNAFLALSDQGDYVVLPEEADMVLPELPEPARYFQLDDDVLADLVADVWYTSYQRLSASNKVKQSSVVIQVTDSINKDETLDIGRSFFCHTLLPALPQPLRRIVSVSIGAQIDDAIDANGGAAAVIIPLPTKSVQATGVYNLSGETVTHTPINPVKRQDAWRKFGKAILRAARGGSSKDYERRLDVFFAIGKKLSGTQISADFGYANAIYNAHDVAEMILQNERNFSTQGSEKSQGLFDKFVWNTLTQKRNELEILGRKDIRESYLPLERDAIAALLGNEQLEISTRYEALFEMAFTVAEEAEPSALREEVIDMYDRLLIRNDEAKRLFVAQLRHTALFANQRSRALRLACEALNELQDVGSDGEEALELFAACGKEEAQCVTKYVVSRMQRGVPIGAYVRFRAVQYGCALDEAVLGRVTSKEQFEKALDGQGEITDFVAYINTPCAQTALSASELGRRYAESFCKHIKNVTLSGNKRCCNCIGQIVGIFRQLGPNAAQSLQEALCTCVDAADRIINEEEATLLASVLCEIGENAQPLQEAIYRQFERRLAQRLSSAAMDLNATLIPRSFTICIGEEKTQVQANLREKMVDAVKARVIENRELLSGSLGTVQQAFDAVHAGDSDACMEALCECISARKQILTMGDVRAIVPVLCAGGEKLGLARQMKDSLSALFGTYIEEIVSSEGRMLEQPWVSCLDEAYACEMQKILGQEIAAKIMTYADANRGELSSRYLRILELHEKFESAKGKHVQAAVDAYCGMLDGRLEGSMQGRLLTQNDIGYLTENLFKQIDASQTNRIIETLNKLFKREIPWLVENEEDRQVWIGCLNVSAIGEAFRSTAFDTIDGYFKENRLQFHEQPEKTVRFMEVFGCDGRRKLGYWINLLEFRIEQAGNEQLLTEAYDHCFSDDMAQAVDRNAIKVLLNAFQIELPWLIRCGELGVWKKVGQKIPNAMRQELEAEERKLYAQELQKKSELSEGELKRLLGIAEELDMFAVAVRFAIERIGERRFTENGLMSSEEHQELEKAVVALKDSGIEEAYLALLGHAPEKTWNEEKLRKQMAEIRCHYYPFLTMETVKTCLHYDEWRAQLTEDILKSLEEMTRSSANSKEAFSALYNADARWLSVCRTPRCVNFKAIQTVIPDRNVLEDACSGAAKAIIAKLHPSLLLEHPRNGVANWYSDLIDRIVSEHVGENMGSLIEECETPEEVKHALEIIGKSSAPEAVALNFVLDYQRDGKLEQLLTEIRSCRPIIDLLKKTVFGRERSLWKNWYPMPKAELVVLSAVCYLEDKDGDWSSFFSEILSGTSTEKSAGSRGEDTIQMVIFASRIMNTCGMETLTKEMSNKLGMSPDSHCQALRNDKRNYRSLKPLRDKRAWETIGADSGVFSFLFEKD